MNQETIKALQEFSHAALKLTVHWDAILDKEYPFHKDFGELEFDISIWVLKTLEKHGNVQDRLRLKYGIYFLPQHVLSYTTNDNTKFRYQFRERDGFWLVEQTNPNIEGFPIINTFTVPNIDRWSWSQIRKALREMKGGYKHGNKTTL